MVAWLIAATAGLLLAGLGYAGRVGRRAPLAVVAAAVRALAATLLVALLLDAPLGAVRAPRPLVALDVSASWTRGTPDAGGAPYASALQAAGSLGADTLLLFGDSLRAAPPPARPDDHASRVRPAVERAVATGRPLVVVSDGVLDDAALLERLPRGSELRLIAAPPLQDLAPVALDAPRAAVGGDTIEVGVRVAAAERAVPPGRLLLMLDEVPLDSMRLDSLPAWGEQRVALRVVAPSREGRGILRAVVRLPGDQEPRNDTLAVPLELSAVAGVTVVSTAPDFDLRYLLDVLRGTTALPTRAYLLVAPGQWRREGSLAPVSEGMVRDAVRRAPILVLHGDTAAFGPPSRLGTGAQLLVPSPLGAEPEWYAVAAPPSPLAPLLTTAPWDSLPPLTAGSAPRGDWTGLVVQRARRFERQAAIAGSDEPRRHAVVAVSGLWRWRFRGGAPADAFTAVWGGIFDWLAAERRDARGVVPDLAVLRAGEPVRWRRGGADSAVRVVLHRRGSTDSLVATLGFTAGSSGTQSPGLAAGVYDVDVPGGRAVLAVNAARELLPARRTALGGPVGSAVAGAGNTPMLRGAVWAYVLLVLLLCAEWLLRRRVGMR